MPRASVRPARFQDIPEILRLIEAAHRQSRYCAFPLDRQQAKAALVGCIGQQQKEAAPGAIMTVVVERDGRLCGVLVGTIRWLYEALGAAIATDLLWYVEPKAPPRAGLHMLQHFEDWATSWPGTVLMRHTLTDAIVDPNRTGRLLERSGYGQTGLVYEKEIGK